MKNIVNTLVLCCVYLCQNDSVQLLLVYVNLRFCCPKILLNIYDFYNLCYWKPFKNVVLDGVKK